MRFSLFMLLCAACGGAQSATSSSQTAMSENSGEIKSGGTQEGDSWDNWKEFANVSPGPWVSKAHGSRLVEIYVNEIGLSAYKSRSEPMPVGSIVVKPSWVNEEGSPGQAGPLFVMEKLPPGSSPETEDWAYAFQWQSPPPKWEAKLGRNVDWRSPSKKVDYCVDCHENYDRALGMLPEERMADW